jgi:hypothetical protein
MYVPCFVKIPCEHSRIKILQWILTKLGIHLVLWRVWNPIDFQGHMSKEKCHTVKFLLRNILVNTLESIWFQTLQRTKSVPGLVKIHWRILILECSQGCHAVKIWPGDIDLWPMTLKINRVPDSPPVPCNTLPHSTNEDLLNIKRKGDPEVSYPLSYVRYHWNPESVCNKSIYICCQSCS